MDLAITTDHPLNTQLVGGGVTYNVCSPGAVQEHTTISRGGTTIIATIDWHSLAPNVLHFGGAEQKVSDFLPRARFSGPNRHFAVDGKTYEWEPVTSNQISPQLVLGDRTYESQRTFMSLLHDKQLVAIMERHSRGGSTLHVSEEARGILDPLVVSLILMWRLMQPTYSSHGGPGYDFGSALSKADGPKSGT
ncbi:hypothetical protein AURDEDRAFT_164969 [Auricularia subglabra TFB-10046 SS5]|nr:hypothetical protein AURDEDRAFT_164969 [Auricularia subglabra TFB-10046 SS5]